jgi:hypothetical protein
VLDYFIKVTAFDELHAEIALAVPFAYLVDGNDAWMVEAGGGFRFPAKALQMRFGSPRAQADHFERDGAIETFLVSAIHYALTAPADFLQQLVVTKVCQHSCWLRGFLSMRRLPDFAATRISDRGYRVIREQAEAGF